MNNYQGRNNSKKFIHSKLALIVFGLFLVFFLYSVIKFSVKALDTAKNKNNAESKIEELQNQKDRLTTDINTLNTQSGVEATIREKYGLAKDGEGLIVITDPEDPNAQNDNTNTSFWSKVKGLFK